MLFLLSIIYNAMLSNQFPIMTSPHACAYVISSTSIQFTSVYAVSLLWSFAVYTRKNHHVVASCQQVVQRLLRSGCSNVVGAAFNNPGYQFVPGC